MEILQALTDFASGSVEPRADAAVPGVLEDAKADEELGRVRRRSKALSKKQVPTTLNARGNTPRSCSPALAQALFFKMIRLLPQLLRPTMPSIASFGGQYEDDSVGLPSLTAASTTDPTLIVAALQLLAACVERARPLPYSHKLAQRFCALLMTEKSSSNASKLICSVGWRSLC